MKYNKLFSIMVINNNNKIINFINRNSKDVITDIFKLTIIYNRKELFLKIINKIKKLNIKYKYDILLKTIFKYKRSFFLKELIYSGYTLYNIPNNVPNKYKLTIKNYKNYINKLYNH